MNRYTIRKSVELEIIRWSNRMKSKPCKYCPPLFQNTGGPRYTRYLLYGDLEIRGFINLTIIEANCTDLTH